MKISGTPFFLGATVAGGRSTAPGYRKRPVLIPHRLPSFYYALYSFQCFSFPAQAEKSFTFKVQQVLFTYQCVLTKVAAAHHISEFFCYNNIVVSCITCPPHSIDSRVKSTECSSSKNFHIIA